MNEAGHGGKAPARRRHRQKRKPPQAANGWYIPIKLRDKLAGMAGGPGLYCGIYWFFVLLPFLEGEGRGGENEAGILAGAETHMRGGLHGGGPVPHNSTKT